MVGDLRWHACGASTTMPTRLGKKGERLIQTGPSIEPRNSTCHLSDITIKPTRPYYIWKLVSLMVRAVWFSSNQILVTYLVQILHFKWNMWGLLVQSVEPGTLDHRVPGSSLVRGGMLCPWTRHFIHIAQTAEVGDASPIWR